MSEGSGATVSAAAARTMCGSARVVITCRVVVPEYDNLQGYTGIVDFESDRCRLDGEPQVEDETEARSVILDGSSTYIPEQHGLWTVTRGAAGTHGTLHPRGLLDALVHAQTSAIASGEHSVEVGLDHDVLNAAAEAGLAPDWESTAVAQLSPSGRIARVTLTHRSREDPDAWMQIDCSISEPDRVGAIDLPASEMRISLQDYIERDHGQPDL